MKYFGSLTTHSFWRSSAPLRFLNGLTNDVAQFLSFLRGWAVLGLLLTWWFMIGLQAGDWLGPLLFSPSLIAEAVVSQK